ncbi:MAG: hypothetical protein L3K04_06975, partial [Thermoplasmata archaeon]|nr:hypothetical protein [Thermoplasmata archaeon]
LSSLVGSLRIGEAVDAPNWVVTLTVPQEYELPPGPSPRNDGPPRAPGRADTSRHALGTA